MHIYPQKFNGPVSYVEDGGPLINLLKHVCMLFSRARNKKILVIEFFNVLVRNIGKKILIVGMFFIATAESKSYLHQWIHTCSISRSQCCANNNVSVACYERP